MMPPPISGKMKRQRGEETLTKLEQREQELEDQTNLEQREEDLEDLQQISGDVTWKRLLASGDRNAIYWFTTYWNTIYDSEGYYAALQVKPGASYGPDIELGAEEEEPQDQSDSWPMMC